MNVFNGRVQSSNCDRAEYILAADALEISLQFKLPFIPDPVLAVNKSGVLSGKREGELGKFGPTGHGQYYQLSVGLSEAKPNDLKLFLG